MTSLRAVLIVAGAAVGFGLIGAVIGLLIASRSTHQLRIPGSEPSIEQRRAVVYLEVVIAWHSYLRAVRTLVYPEEGPPANGPRDLASVLHARSQLQAVGTPVVQGLHDQVLDSAVMLIDLLRSQPMSVLLDLADTQAQRGSLRLVFTTISERIGALERQMLGEVGPLPRPLEDHIEMTGRAMARRGATAQPTIRS
jgi:hypothetical protein